MDTPKNTPPRKGDQPATNAPKKRPRDIQLQPLQSLKPQRLDLSGISSVKAGDFCGAEKKGAPQTKLARVKQFFRKKPAVGDLTRAASLPTSPSSKAGSFFTYRNQQRRSLPVTPTPRALCEEINRLHINKENDKEKLLVHAVLGHAAAYKILKKHQGKLEDSPLDLKIKEFIRDHEQAVKQETIEQKNAEQEIAERKTAEQKAEDDEWNFGGKQAEVVFPLIKKHARYFSDFYLKRRNVANFWMSASSASEMHKVKKYHKLFPYVYLANALATHVEGSRLTDNIFSDYQRMYRQQVSAEFEANRRVIQKNVLIFSIERLDNLSINRKLSKVLLRVQVAILVKNPRLDVNNQVGYMMELMVRKNCHESILYILDEYARVEQDADEFLMARKVCFAFFAVVSGKAIAYDRGKAKFICEKFFVEFNGGISDLIGENIKSDVIAEIMQNIDAACLDSLLSFQAIATLVKRKSFMRAATVAALINHQAYMNWCRQQDDSEFLYVKVIDLLAADVVGAEAAVALLNNKDFVMWCVDNMSSHLSLTKLVSIANQLVESDAWCKINITHLLKLNYACALVFAQQLGEQKVDNENAVTEDCNNQSSMSEFDRAMNAIMLLPLAEFELWREFIMALQNHKKLSLLEVYLKRKLDALTEDDSAKEDLHGVKVKIIFGYLRICKVLYIDGGDKPKKGYQKAYISSIVVKPQELLLLGNFDAHPVMPVLKELYQQITKTQKLSAFGFASSYVAKAAALYELYLEFFHKTVSGQVNNENFVPMVLNDWGDRARLGIKSPAGAELNTYRELIKQKRFVIFSKKKSSDKTAANQFIENLNKKYQDGLPGPG